MQVTNQGGIQPTRGQPPVQPPKTWFGHVCSWFSRGKIDPTKEAETNVANQVLSHTKNEEVQMGRSLGASSRPFFGSADYWGERDGVTASLNPLHILVDIQGEHVRPIGSGANGEVKALTIQGSSEPKMVVVKHLPPVAFSGCRDWEVMQPATEALFREANVASQLNAHPFCGHLLYAHMVPGHPNHVDYTVQEPITGGSLQDRVNSREIENIPMELRIRWAKQLASAVSFMNGLGYVHRDLKCDNVLFTSRGPEAEARLIDFGCAAKSGERCEQDGNRMAEPPELVVKGGICPRVPEGYDSCGLGWVLCEMLAGKERLDQLKQSLGKNLPNQSQIRALFPPGDIASDHISEVISGLLHPDPAQRLTTKQAEERLAAYFP